jgi:hypothetical protein
VKKLPSGQWQVTPTTTMKTVTRKILTVAAIIVFVTTIVPTIWLMVLMASLMLDAHLGQHANYNYNAASAALTQLTFTLALVALFIVRSITDSWKLGWIMAAITLVVAPPVCVALKWLGV